MPHRRAAKRIKNRLAKKGLAFLRFEQSPGDRNLTLACVILQNRDGLGRAFTYPRDWVRKAPPRVIADGVISDYLEGYGSLAA